MGASNNTTTSIEEEHKPIEHRKRLDRILSWWFGPAVLTGLFISVLITALWLVEENTHELKRKEIVASAESAGASILLRLKGNQDYLLLLAKEWGNGVMDARMFQELASRYVLDHPELTNIMWVDARFIVHDVAPLTSNKQIRRLLLDLPEPNRASRLAMKRRQPVYSRPFEAIQGGPAFEIWVPVFHEDVFLGLFGGVYSCEKFVKNLIPSQVLKNNHVSLRDTSGSVLFELPASGALGADLVHQVSLTPQESGVLLQFNAYGRSALECNLLLLEFLCLALALGIAWAMWSLKRENEVVRQSEIALSESERRLRLALCIGKIGVFEVNLKSGEGQWTPEIAAIWGTPGDFTGNITDFCWEHVHPEDVARVKKEYALIVQNNKEAEMQFRIVRQDGSVRWIHWLGLSIQGVTKDDDRIIGVNIDITERKQAEEALYRMAAIVEYSDDAIIGKSLEGIILSWNRGAELLYGYSEEEVKGRSASILAPQELAGELPYILDLINEGKPVEHYETWRLRKNGSRIEVSLTVSPICDFTGKIIGASTIAHDITDHKRVEDALRKERALLRCLIDSASDVIFIKDRDGVYLGCNKASEAFLGIPESGQIGKTDFDFFDREKAEAIREIDRQVLEIGKPFRKEELVINREGVQMFFDTLKAPCFDPEGNILGLVGICRDVTERKRIEEEVKLARDVAEAANRAKSSFLANMSHEIKTPISGIIGMSELLKQTDISEDQRELLKCIDISSNKLLHLVNDVLDLSRNEAGRIELENVEFSPRKCIGDAIAFQIMQIQSKNLEMRKEIADDIPDLVIGDEARLSQIMNNLLDNAGKFTDSGGITVKADLVLLEGESALIRFSVVDTGIGMSHETMAKIFTPFTQADASTARRFGGTGLGLAICRNLAELMGGRIWAESSQGQGSTFHVAIPFVVRKHADRKAEGAVPIAPFWEGRPLTILVAEDDAINRIFIESILAKMGHSFVSVGDGNQAVEKWRSMPFDCILMDIQMSGMDGIQATVRIRQEEKGTGAHVPIFACTASGIRDLELIVEGNFDGYLCKPLEWKKLRTALLSCCDESRSPQSHRKLEEYFQGSEVPVGWQESPCTMDIANALERMNGDVQFYRSLLNKFMESHEKNLRELREAVSSGNFHNASTIVHNLKGVAGLLSLTGVHKIIGEMERELAAGESVKAAEYLGDLENVFMEIAVSIRNLAPLKAGQDDGTDDAKGSLDDIPALIEELDRLLGRGSLDSRRQSALLGNALPDSRFQKELGEIDSCLEKFNFKGALVTLHQLKEKTGIEFR